MRSGAGPQASPGAVARDAKGSWAVRLAGLYENADSAPVSFKIIVIVIVKRAIAMRSARK
jgi:hypothetical protein